MVKRIGKSRRKTRYKLKRDKRKKGKISLNEYFKVFKPGDKVNLTANSAVQKGMYHPRFYGKAGIIKAKQGNCYQVLIKDKNKEKTVIVHPVHLRRV